MLNPFPDLLTYSLLAPFMLRLVAGLIFVNLGTLAFKKEKNRWLYSITALKIPKPELVLKIISTLEIVGGIMLILGFYTQLAALILSVFTLAEIFVEHRDPTILKRNYVFYLMLFIISLSLLFSGAGAYAIDLPL